MSDCLARRKPVAWGSIGGVAAVLSALSLGTAFVPGYGYMADELYYLSCADRLAWGYVDHPPFSIAVLAGFRSLLGDSLAALRMLSSLFAAASVVAVGMLARELGGGRAAQFLAVLAWAAAPTVQFVASFQSMNVIECLLWPVAALLVARALRESDERSWYTLGLVLGVALLNKLSTLWLGFGLALGLVLTEERSRLRGKMPWLSGAIALGFLLPHGIWQSRNGWPLADFIRGYGEEVAVTGGVLASPLEFVAAQLIAMNPLSLPLWLAGLGWFFLRARGRRFRPLAWMWLGVFMTLLVSGRSQAYYLTPAYPILLAAGGVWFEELGATRRWLIPLCATSIVAGAVLLLPIAMPILTPDAFNRYQAGFGIPDQDGELPPHFRWRIGWEELADAVRDSHAALESQERRRTGLLAIGFPAAGALEHFGPMRGLPPVIGTHNDYWLWGPGDQDGETMLIVAPPEHPVLTGFSEVGEGAPIPCQYCAGGTRDQRIYLARKPIRPLAALWNEWRDYR